MHFKLKELLKTLSIQGGALVSSADCSEMEIADAQGRGDWYVDEDGMGFVLRMPEWHQRRCSHARGTKVQANPLALGSG